MTRSRETESVGREFVSIEPTEKELFGSFIFYLTKHASEEKMQIGIPEEREIFMQGLAKAAEKAPFLAKFMEDDKGVTPVEEMLTQLIAEGILVFSNGLLIIDNSKRDHVASVSRSLFREQGIAVLKEAAAAARAIWSKQKK